MQGDSYRLILKRNPRVRRPWALPVHVAADALLWILIVSAQMYLPKIYAAAATVPLFCIFSFRAFAMMHECVHGSFLINRRLNYWVGYAYGVFCFLPFAGWRDMHIDHHKWTGNLDLDPTTKILLQFEKEGFRAPALLRFSWWSRLPLIGFMQHVVFWKATVKSKEAPFVFLSGGYLIGLGFALGPLTILAGLFAYLVLVEAINLPHHLGLPQARGKTHFAPEKQDAFARSCLYPKWFARHVLLNFNLHAAHHLYPAHPWYQLENLHEEIIAAGGGENLSEGHAWHRAHRPMALADVFALTFAARESKTEEKPRRAA